METLHLYIGHIHLIHLIESIVKDGGELNRLLCVVWVQKS